jgi:hypothetical protein
LSLFVNGVEFRIRGVESVRVFIVRWRKEGVSSFFLKREVQVAKAQYLMMKDTKSMVVVEESV